MTINFDFIQIHTRIPRERQRDKWCVCEQRPSSWGVIYTRCAHTIIKWITKSLCVCLTPYRSCNLSIQCTLQFANDNQYNGTCGLWIVWLFFFFWRNWNLRKKECVDFVILSLINAIAAWWLNLSPIKRIAWKITIFIQILSFSNVFFFKQNW